MYAFLPREAVTRFLMSCSDCQKRMHLQYNNSSNGDQGCQSNEDLGFNHKSKSMNAAAKISRLMISNNGLSPESYSNGNESDQEDEDQDKASSFAPIAHQQQQYHHHHHQRGLEVIMDVNENQVYTPRITQEIRKAVKKSKAVTSRAKGLSVRASAVRDHIQGKRKAASLKGTTGKSASACKKIRLNNNNSNKVHRQKDQESAITNGKWSLCQDLFSGRFSRTSSSLLTFLVRLFFVAFYLSLLSLTPVNTLVM